MTAQSGNGMCLRIKDPDLAERFRAAARERGMKYDRLAEAAIKDFLDRLIPIEELKLTRES